MISCTRRGIVIITRVIPLFMKRVGADRNRSELEPYERSSTSSAVLTHDSCRREALTHTPSAVSAASFAKRRMSARTRTATAELERLASRSRALRRCGSSTKANVVKRSSTESAADSRTAARECEAADIIAQRAGRGDPGRTADGITRGEARCRSHRLHGRRVMHRWQRPGCRMRAISTV
jgi:hypothetical protein